MDSHHEVSLPAEVRHEPRRQLASWYGGKFHGRTMANGQRYDSRKLTAAHRTLPLGTRVRIRSVANGRTVDVEVTDRGPYVRGRAWDLSVAAASRLGMVRAGVMMVEAWVISQEERAP